MKSRHRSITSAHLVLLALMVGAGCMQTGCAADAPEASQEAAATTVATTEATEPETIKPETKKPETTEPETTEPEPTETEPAETEPAPVEEEISFYTTDDNLFMMTGTQIFGMTEEELSEALGTDLAPAEDFPYWDYGLTITHYTSTDGVELSFVFQYGLLGVVVHDDMTPFDEQAYAAAVAQYGDEQRYEYDNGLSWAVMPVDNNCYYNIEEDVYATTGEAACHQRYISYDVNLHDMDDPNDSGSHHFSNHDDYDYDDDDYGYAYDPDDDYYGDNDYNNDGELDYDEWQGALDDFLTDWGY